LKQFSISLSSLLEKEAEYDYMGRIVYPMCALGFFSVMMLAVTEIYFCRKHKKLEQKFSLLNQEELYRAKEESAAEIDC
jgi:hypothetical protein